MLKNQVRIIGGQWRGRKITFPGNSQVRPTPDRIKETLFNWLAPYIRDANCLELFAGSASLSFEALSRYAASAIAVEKDLETVKAMQNSAKMLETTQLQIIQADCFSWLKTTEPNHPFDIVFIDPPYAIKGLQESFVLVNKPKWLRSSALIYFESDVPLVAEDFPSNWQLLKEKKAGRVYYYLMQKEGSDLTK